jgi:hypothetical protein
MRHDDKPSVEPPMVLSEEYLRHIRIVELLPENQSGADKTWVESAIRAWKEHYANAVRIR